MTTGWSSSTSRSWDGALPSISRRLGAGPAARTRTVYGPPVPAEQKNYDAVRKTAGYFRFDTPAEQEALGEVYKYRCPLCNYWYPFFRLVDKEEQGDGRYKKIYEKSPRIP
jgi:hypothetical protein